MDRPRRAHRGPIPAITMLVALVAACGSTTATLAPSVPASEATTPPTAAPGTATAAPATPTSSPEATPAVSPSSGVTSPAAFTTSVPPTSDAGWTSLQFAKLPPDSPLAGITSVARTPGGGFLALGSNVRDVTAGTVTTPAWSSADGASWAPLDPATFGASTVVLRVGATANGPVAVTVGATIGDCQPSDDPSCFSAVGPVQSWTSSDGTTWTAHDVVGIDLPPSGGDNVSPPRVAIGPGGVLVDQPVSHGTQLALSTDGATWQALPAATIPARAAIGDMEAFGDGFVALGADPDGQRPVALLSSDGRTWTEHRLPFQEAGLGAGGDLALVAQNGILAEGSVAATPGQSLWWTTDDGSTWKRDPKYGPLGVWNGEGEGTGLIEDGSTGADGERIVALRRDGGLEGWTSTNGHEWFKLQVSGLEPTPKGSWPDLDITQLPIGVLYRADDGTTWFGTPSDL